MTGREKVFATVLLVLFFGVGLATLYEGVLIINEYTVKNHGNDTLPPQSAISAASGATGSLEFSGEPTRTPMMPALPTPISATQTEVITATANPKVYTEDLSLAEALQMGWTTVTVFTPWGDPMVFSFQPVTVNFWEPNFDWVCPYYEQNACLAVRDEGVYALTHSEYPGAVAEQARSVVEGSLYSLDTIESNVAMLTGSEAEISLQDGRVLRATVTNFTRTTGAWNIYNLANNREVLSNRLIIEFCGLPHMEDRTDSAGATGSIYLLTLSKGD